MKAKCLILCVTTCAASAQGAPRSSASYSVPADSTDCGGQRTSSAAYTNDGSAGGITGVSSVAVPAETAKAGYIGQLTDVTALQLAATPTTVNETATRQLSGAQLLDDLTTNAVPVTSISWSVQSGPLTGISTSGLATAAIVYQNTAATAQGIFAGNTGTLNLTVLDSIADNFGSYAGDGVGDDWQVQYFGQPPNSNAGPNVDFDGTGQTNLFKYIAGLNPLDPNSRFILKIAPVPDQPGQKNLVFSPRFTDRNYVVKASPDLSSGSFIPLTNPSAPSDSGQERTITDLSASGARKFYRVEITKP